MEQDGQVMLISGEAGIGKSRILFSLAQDFAANEAQQFILLGSVIHKNSAFYSVKASLHSLIGLADSDTAEDRRAKLHSFLTELEINADKVATPIARLMGFDEDLGELAPASLPEKEKVETINALTELCVSLSQQKPLLLMVDDAHWIDPSTLEFLSRWVNMLSQQCCLLLVTARPEFVSPWKNLAHATTLELNRFGKRETIALIESIAGSRPDKALLDQIVARTDGVPLFIEELTKMVMDYGILADDASFDGELSHDIPESLQDILMARLDKLNTVKKIAQIASVIGRTFSLSVVSKVHNKAESVIQEAFVKLVDADLIVSISGPGEDPVFRFRHALV